MKRLLVLVAVLAFFLVAMPTSDSPAVPPGKIKLKVVPVTLTGKIPLPIGPIEPYGEFGIGGYIMKAEVSGSFSNINGSTKGVFGLHAGGGVNFNISPVRLLGRRG